MRIRINKRITTYSGMAGSLLFVILFLIQDIFTPGFNWLKTTVSEHSIGQSGWIQITNFIVSGLFLFIFALGIAKEFRDRIFSRFGSLFQTIFSICIIASGPFVTDPLPVILFSNQATWHGNVHGILGAIAFILMALICFMYYRRLRNDQIWKPFAKWTLIAFFIIVIGIILLKVEQQRITLQELPISLVGFYQRIVLITFFTWEFWFAMNIFRYEIKNKIHQNSSLLNDTSS